MKARIRSIRGMPIWVGVALVLSAVGWGSPKSWALPPIVHAREGSIESIHLPTRTLVVILDEARETKAFVWTDRTRFVIGGEDVAPKSLRKGMTVTVFYRKELGRFVLREVKVETEVKTSRTKPGPGFP
jgi:hypothetical protein